MQPAPRPRLKTAAPLLRGGGLLHIVGSRSVHTIADPDGAIHRLVELADGSRSIAELCAALRAEYPRIRATEELAPPAPHRATRAGQALRSEDEQREASMFAESAARLGRNRRIG